MRSKMICPLLICLVLFSFLTRPVTGENPLRIQSANTSDLAAHLNAIEQAVETKRKEQHVPGMTLAIVKNDEVIYLKGFGVADLESSKPVTPDTVFSIGSSTKSFTAMAAVMSEDDGKLSLEDSPRKYLQYFKMRDPEMDAKVTIRDLLCHRTGLARADMAFSSGKLNRAEVIQVNSSAKPTAKLGQTFQYNNVMFAAAGAAIGSAQHSSWDAYVTQRIFKSLGMDASSLSIEARNKSSDLAIGYEFNRETNQVTKMPVVDLDVIAPAGAINSNGKDMAKWLRFLIAGGVWNDKRLVSERGYRELVTKQMNIAPGFDYGLGWYLDDWKGQRSIYHGGNIAGFSTQVAFLPDQKLGFVLLMNLDRADSMADAVMDVVYSNLVDALPKNDAAVTSAETNSGTKLNPASAGNGTQAFAELIGNYQSAIARGPIEITTKEGRLVWLNAQKQAIPMAELSKDHFTLSGIPGVHIYALRDADGKINRLSLRQASGDFEFDRVGSFVPSITVKELMDQVIVAMGGEANIRRHNSVVKNIAIDYETQGITADMIVLNKSPNLLADHIVLQALGKQIGTIDEYFDGTRGEGEASYGTRRHVVLTSAEIDNEKINDAFYGLLDWKTLFARLEIKQKTKLGSEEVLIVVATPSKGTPVAYWISTKSFLVLRKDVLSFPRTLTILLDDYRDVDGEKVPFKETRTHRVGISDSEVLRLKEIKFNVDLPDSRFHPSH